MQYNIIYIIYYILCRDKHLTACITFLPQLSSKMTQLCKLAAK